MKQILIIILIIIILGTTFWYIIGIFNHPEFIHYHAGFRVYINSTLQDFSDDQYMNFAGCSLRGKSENNQEEKAHLHDNVGEVVHVHRSGAVWGDLFNNIKFSFPTNSPITGYVNGKNVDNILSYSIKPYDSVIIIAGESSNIDLNNYVLKSQILKVEQKSESCPN
jgi:hypothetical protein